MITIEHGLEFVNRHILLIGPKAISTYITHDGQIKYNTSGRFLTTEETLARYKQANYIDCRISGYPIYHPPDRTDIPCSLFMADIDQKDFKTSEDFESCSKRTLQNFDRLLGCSPTQIWSGGGYHFIQPIDGIVFESVKEFGKFRQPSRRFMHFLEWLVTNGMADYNHWNTVSFRNLMLRIPGSYNGKYILFDGANNILNIPPKSQVHIIKEWDGKALTPSGQLITEYYVWLQSQEINRIHAQRMREESDLGRYGYYSKRRRPVFYQNRTKRD